MEQQLSVYVHECVGVRLSMHPGTCLHVCTRSSTCMCVCAVVHLCASVRVGGWCRALT